MTEAEQIPIASRYHRSGTMRPIHLSWSMNKSNK